MSKFLSSRFARLKTYTPGEQPKDAEYIKLNTNESPYPPSPLVIERVADAAQVRNLRLYPDPEGTELRRKIAALYGTTPKNIFLSNGSDEILSFAFMAFCDGERQIAFPDVSYGFYKVYAELYGVGYTEIPLAPDFTLNSADYCGIGKNIVIANPNAPTGMAITLEEIERILVTNPDRIVMIDEAYVDFGGASSVELTKKYDNLLVIMTFSKSRSLAGARLGFAVAHEAIIEDLNKIKYSTNPYNVNRLTLAAGEAAIDDDAYYKAKSREIAETREFTAETLAGMGFEVLPSRANFIFAKHPAIGGEALYKKLKERGVLVRHFDAERTRDFVRITIGAPEEMRAFIEKIQEIMQN
ncbi:MAG: histidinol-phosphate transaminase [Oscillospiraceae bacterium]|nr:histidinol-phosphate transaminase [Oscillospiraceae bacterium]